MDKLSANLWIEILCQLDDIRDVVNRYFHRLLSSENQKLWKRLTFAHIVSSPYGVKEILEETALLGGQLHYADPPNWKEYVVQKVRNSFVPLHVDLARTMNLDQGTSARQEEEQWISLQLESVRKALAQLQDMPRHQQATQLPDILCQACSQLLHVVERNGTVLEAFFLLATACLLMQEYDAALKLIAIGREVHSLVFDTEEEPLEMLEQLEETVFEEMRLGEEQAHSDFAPESEGESDYEELSGRTGNNSKEQGEESVEERLARAFDHFDRDRDGCFSYSELADYLQVTNCNSTNSTNPFSGTRCGTYTEKGNPSPFLPPAMFQQLLRAHGDMMRTARKLSKQGFLAFYRQQTLLEPEETWKDLQKVEQYIMLVLGGQ